MSCVPPPCGRTFDGGISGSAISHSPSGTIQLHVPRPITSPTIQHHIGHGLNNSFTALYARKLIEDHPHWAPAFELRRRRTS
ncbi:hypothetical protein AB0K57_29585 [Streptomyces halstedii]|uniref:hypothetical protein n=1 Tax=Streptomyces halstedii TaxID=1944 RepID=UPI0034617300